MVVRSNCCRILLALTLGLGGLVPGFKTILSADPASTTPATASPQPPADKSSQNPPKSAARNPNNALKQLEKDLFNPLASVRQDPAMERALHPQLPPPARQLTPEQKEAYARKKNWIFMDPNDNGKVPSMEEVLGVQQYGADGQPKKKQGSLEGFLKSSGKKTSDQSNTSGEKDAFETVKDFNHGRTIHGDSELPRDPNLPEGLNEKESDFRKNLADAPQVNGHGTLNDVFGLGRKARSADEIRQSKERMNDFREILGLPSAPITVVETRKAGGLDVIDNTPARLSGNFGLANPGPAPRNDWLNNPFGNNGANGLPGRTGSPFDSSPSKNVFTPAPLPAAPVKSQPAQYPITTPQNFTFPQRSF